MSFLDIVSKFNQQATSHSTSQSLNPFSEQFEQSRSPSPRFSREEYGKPIAGSKTDLRGRKAKTHICREILELCTVIHDVGTYKAKKRDPDDSDDEQDDGTIIVSFGELFQIYTKISDKVVGLLIAAKRRGFVYFDREILFQRRDDDVLIALMKPISEINKILKDDISQTNAPAPVGPTPAVEKNKSSSSNKTKRAKSSSDKKPKIMTTDCAVLVDEADAVSASTEVQVNGEEVAEKIGTEGPEDIGDQSRCNGEVNGLPDDDERSCTSRSDEDVNGDGLSVAGIEIDDDADAGVPKDEIIEISEGIEDESVRVDDDETKVSNMSNGDVTESESGIGESVEADDEVVREETENVENEKRTQVDASNNGEGENIGKVTEHDTALLPLNEN